jgi:hypothetical protein
MMKIASLAACLGLAAMTLPALADSPSHSESSCATEALASAKNYEHEQGIIWGKLGGVIRDFRHEHHFDAWKGRCLLEVDFKIAQKDAIVTTRFLVDAFERRIYATFYGTAPKANEQQAHVMTCNYGFAYNEAGHCTSEGEYDSVVKTMVQ